MPIKNTIRPTSNIVGRLTGIVPRVVGSGVLALSEIDPTYFMIQFRLQIDGYDG